MGDHSARGAASASTAVFHNVATELAMRLEKRDDALARTLAEEARELAAVFDEWEREGPVPHERAHRVRALLDLQRRAMEYLSSRHD